MEDTLDDILNSIFESCDIMSRLMLSMTRKRINSIYNSNGYITNKKIPIKLLIYRNNKTSLITGGVYAIQYTLNIKLCNTLNDIVDKISKLIVTAKYRINNIKIYKYIENFKDSKIIHEPGMISYQYNSKDCNKPVGFLDIWYDMNYVSVFGKEY